MSILIIIRYLISINFTINFLEYFLRISNYYFLQANSIDRALLKNLQKMQIKI